MELAAGWAKVERKQQISIPDFFRRRRCYASRPQIWPPRPWLKTTIASVFGRARAGRPPETELHTFFLIRPPVFHNFAATVAIAVGLSASWADEEERLVDESLDPPTVFSPDFVETPHPAEKSAPVQQAFGPVAPSTRQPTGALSGRIVFTNGGHGWTFDPDHWRLQRPVLQQMNEDCGNIDQMNFFASYCFNAGAVVVPMRPLGHQNNEVILDNDSAGVTYAGGWSDTDSTIYYGSPGDVAYRTAAFAATETATATYTPNIPGVVTGKPVEVGGSLGRAESTGSSP